MNAENEAGRKISGVVFVNVQHFSTNFVLYILRRLMRVSAMLALLVLLNKLKTSGMMQLN